MIANLDSSRRNFLKRLSQGFLVVALYPKKLFSKAKTYGVLVDMTRCISCRACSRACVEANSLHPADDGSNISQSHSEKLAFDKWSAINTIKGTGVKKQCMHCLEPACVSVCPVGALYQTESGPVIYRTERCIGCRYCMIACPFEVPKFDWKSGLTPVIGKCQLCAQNRIFKGLEPGCTQACPTGALKFGKRQALLFEAKVRIKANPKKYVNRIYGENEIGGTSWMYLSGVPFEDLGFKTKLPDSPIPTFTWEVVSRLPIVVACLMGLFGTVAIHLKKQSESK